MPMNTGPAVVEVRIETSAGDITAVLEPRAAPLTVCNFLRYIQGGEYDHGTFFRTVVASRPSVSPVPINVIQAAPRRGNGLDLFGPIPLERTSQTGLKHQVGTLSMARFGPDTATSGFFILTDDTPSLDFGGKRNPDGQGFAAFGRVLSGMAVVRHIHDAPSTGETLMPPIDIRRITIVSPSRMGRRLLPNCTVAGQ